MGAIVVNLHANLDDQAPEAAPAGGRRPGRGSLRWIVNTWLVFHLSAIVIAPASVSPSSDLVRSAWDVVHPYLDVLFLNHGYHFFAPEPAESTLLAFEARREDGTTVKGRIPDRATAPRLLYHRYFMLTEHLAGAPEELLKPWRESYARHIGHAQGASRVSLIQQTHFLPTMERVRGGGRLNDPESYEDQALGTFRCDGS